LGPSKKYVTLFWPTLNIPPSCVTLRDVTFLLSKIQAFSRIYCKQLKTGNCCKKGKKMSRDTLVQPLGPSLTHVLFGNHPLRTLRMSPIFWMAPNGDNVVNTRNKDASKIIKSLICSSRTKELILNLAKKRRFLLECF